MTALSVFADAISEALLPSSTRPNPKPASRKGSRAATAPHIIDSTFGDNFMEKFMTDPFADRSDESQRGRLGARSA